MKYHFINQITNPQQIVANKVNYFADIFDYYLSYLGKPTFPNLENHKSLLEKICFQLENYSPTSQKYVYSYFKNGYLTLKDPVIAEFYKKEWQRINSLKVSGIEKNRKKLLTQLRHLITKLDRTLFINVLSKIIECLICTTRLEKSLTTNKLEYYTPILISEFIFAGFPKNDLNKLFDKILSTKVEIQNNKVRTEIPLPASVLKHKLKTASNPESFYNKINAYLKKRTLQQQFEGIYHLYKNSSKEKTFIFYLKNIRAIHPIDFVIEEVRFSNQLKKENIKKNKTNKEYRTFFKDKETVFVQTTLNENNDYVGKEKAIRRINHAINYLNACLDKKVYLSHDDFIIKDNDQNVRHKSMLIPLHPSDMEKLTNDNVYDVLKNHKYNLVNRYFELDKIYMSATTSEFKEVKIINYWRYLESFFEAEDFKSATIINSISDILSKKSDIPFLLDYYNLAFQVLFTAYLKYPTKTSDGLNSYLEIPMNDLQNLLNTRNLDEVELRKLGEVINHPFVNKKLKWLLSKNSEQKVKIAYDFYQNILFETYEQRNFIEHSGLFLEKSVDKILISLPKIVRDFRSQIVNELPTKEYRSFAEVISTLNS